MRQKSFNFLKAKPLTLKEPQQGQKAEVSSAAVHKPTGTLRYFLQFREGTTPSFHKRSDKSLSSTHTDKEGLRRDTTLCVGAELQRLYPQPPPAGTALLSPLPALQVTEAQTLCPPMSGPARNLAFPPSNSHLLWLFH